jgi:hypothetical protein
MNQKQVVLPEEERGSPCCESCSQNKEEIFQVTGYYCLHCWHTVYMDNVKAAEQSVQALDNNRNDSYPPISVVSDPATHTGSNRDATRFRNIVDVRARSLRVRRNQGLHVDDDTVRLV